MSEATPVVDALRALVDAGESADDAAVCAAVRAALDGEAAGEANESEASTGATPLMLAAQLGSSEAVQLLLQQGAVWNAQDRQGNTAGEYALEAGAGDVYEAVLEAGVRTELLLAAMQRETTSKRLAKEAPASNADYLQQKLAYSEGRLVDSEANGVMMGWEEPLMVEHARVLAGTYDESIDASTRSVLNIGFGLGLIDSEIQKLGVGKHTIIEAHPDVLAHMRATGWYEKPNVRILEGRWQDVMDQLETYDGIFFDTFGEYYDDMTVLHEELPRLVKPGGVYSFFNGLCATNATFHAVYCRIAAQDLAALGFAVQYVPVPIDANDARIWDGIKRRYWSLDFYLLPICIMQAVEQEAVVVEA